MSVSRSTQSDEALAVYKKMESAVSKDRTVADKLTATRQRLAFERRLYHLKCKQLSSEQADPAKNKQLEGFMNIVNNNYVSGGGKDNKWQIQSLYARTASKTEQRDNPRTVHVVMCDENVPGVEDEYPVLVYVTRCLSPSHVGLDPGFTFNFWNLMTNQDGTTYVYESTSVLRVSSTIHVFHGYAFHPAYVVFIYSKFGPDAVEAAREELHRTVLTFASEIAAKCPDMRSNKQFITPRNPGFHTMVTTNYVPIPNCRVMERRAVVGQIVEGRFACFELESAEPSGLPQTRSATETLQLTDQDPTSEVAKELADPNTYALFTSSNAASAVLPFRPAVTDLRLNVPSVPSLSFTQGRPDQINVPDQVVEEAVEDAILAAGTEHQLQVPLSVKHILSEDSVGPKPDTPADSKIVVDLPGDAVKTSQSQVTEVIHSQDLPPIEGRNTLSTDKLSTLKPTYSTKAKNASDYNLTRAFEQAKKEAEPDENHRPTKGKRGSRDHPDAVNSQYGDLYRPTYSQANQHSVGSQQGPHRQSKKQTLAPPNNNPKGEAFQHASIKAVQGAGTALVPQEISSQQSGGAYSRATGTHLQSSRPIENLKSASTDEQLLLPINPTGRSRVTDVPTSLSASRITTLAGDREMGLVVSASRSRKHQPVLRTPPSGPQGRERANNPLNIQKTTSGVSTLRYATFENTLSYRPRMQESFENDVSEEGEISSPPDKLREHKTQELGPLFDSEPRRAQSPLAIRTNPQSSHSLTAQTSNSMHDPPELLAPAADKTVREMSNLQSQKQLFKEHTRSRTHATRGDAYPHWQNQRHELPPRAVRTDEKPRVKRAKMTDDDSHSRFGDPAGSKQDHKPGHSRSSWSTTAEMSDSTRRYSRRPRSLKGSSSRHHESSRSRSTRESTEATGLASERTVEPVVDWGEERREEKTEEKKPQSRHDRLVQLGVKRKSLFG